MKYGQLLSESWSLTESAKKLKWFAFFPSFAAVLIFVVEIAWQLYLFASTFDFGSVNIGLKDVTSAFGFLAEYNLVAWIIIFAVLVILFGMVLPAWVQGVLMVGVRDKIAQPEGYLSLRKWMLEGGDHFFQLFELHAVLGIFSLSSIGFFTATFYRYYHDTLFDFAWPFLLVYAIFSIVVTMFTFFAPHFIVLEGDGFQQAIKKSISLVFLHMGATISMLLLMFLIHFRIILHTLLIFVIPVAVAGVWVSFEAEWVKWLSGILGGGLLMLSSYMAALLDVFATTVWMKTFIRLREEG